MIDQLCKLGNGDKDGNSDGNRIAQKARSLLAARPQPKSAKDVPADENRAKIRGALLAATKELERHVDSAYCEQSLKDEDIFEKLAQARVSLDVEDKPSVPMAMLIKCRDTWPPDGVSRKEALREICKAYGYEVTE